MSVRTARVAAVLMAGALLLHELAYAVAGGGLIGAHGYLEVLAPVAVAAAASLAFGSLLPAALDARNEHARPLMPLALAGALLGIFAAQELAEASLMGGGAAGFAASLSVAWLAPPLALLFGALGSAALLALDGAERLLATPSSAPPLPAREGHLDAAPERPGLKPLAYRGLRFGFARRPPPLAA